MTTINGSGMRHHPQLQQLQKTNLLLNTTEVLLEVAMLRGGAQVET